MWNRPLHGVVRTAPVHDNQIAIVTVSDFLGKSSNKIPASFELRTSCGRFIERKVLARPSSLCGTDSVTDLLPLGAGTHIPT